MNKSDFAIFIKKRRKELGMTQEELATKLHVSRKVVSKWENGERYPDLETAQLLIEALCISSEELFEQSSINDNKALDIVRNALVGVTAVVMILGLVLIPIAIHKRIVASHNPTNETSAEDTNNGCLYPDVAFVQQNTVSKVFENYIYAIDSDGDYIKICGSNDCKHGTSCPAYVRNNGISFVYNGRRILISENDRIIDTNGSIRFVSTIYEFNEDNSSRNSVKNIDFHIENNAILFKGKLYFVGKCESNSGGEFVKRALCSLDLSNYNLIEIEHFDGAFAGFENHFWVDGDKLLFEYIKTLSNETEYEQKIFRLEQEALIEINQQETELVNYIGSSNGRLFYYYMPHLEDSRAQYIYYYDGDEIHTYMKFDNYIDIKIVGNNIVTFSRNNIGTNEYISTIKIFSQDAKLLRSKTLNNMNVKVYATINNLVYYSIGTGNEHSSIRVSELNQFLNFDFDMDLLTGE